MPPQTIDLHGDWEVGLYSISYPNTWYRLRKYENYLYYSTNGNIFSKSASVDFGYFETVEDFIDAVNKTLLESIGIDNVYLTFNPRTAKVKVYIKKKRGLEFFGKLSTMVGFGGKDTKLFKTTESPFVADLFGITCSNLRSLRYRSTTNRWRYKRPFTSNHSCQWKVRPRPDKFLRRP